MSTAPRRRVVVIDPSPAPTGALRGAINIARAVGSTAETLLVLAATAQVDDVDLSAFTRVVRVPMRQIRRSPLDLAFYLPGLVTAAIRLRRMLRDEDVVVVNDFYLLHGWMLRRLGFRGRVVSWVRIDPLVFPAALRRVWLAAVSASSDAVVAVSGFIADRLRTHGIEPTLLYDPVDPSTIPSPAGRPAMQRLVQVANFTRGKGQDDAIAAFAQVAPRFPAATLTLRGGDMGLARNRDYRAGLERQATAAGLAGRVVFGGFAVDPGAALADADGALVLSHRESFSLACLEASAAGLPVIATRCGGPEEIVRDGETGWLCPVGDIDAIAAAMERLLADPAAAVAMGHQGAEWVRQRFSPASFTAGVSGLLFADASQSLGSPIETGG